MRSVTGITTVALLLLFTCFLSCKKDVDETPAGFPDQVPDFVTKVTSSVSGFVTDHFDGAVAGATVKVGTATTITDNFGYFRINNVQVVKDAAVVSVEYAGFFKGIKTYMASEGKAAFFRIKLLPKTTQGSISGSSGGSVTLTNGLSISLPAGAVKNATTGTAYTGQVNVAAQWIDPTSPELNQIMPGDLRGITTGGFMKALTTYGMAGVELRGTAGELLQLADGKKATMSFPVPASISAGAPTTIPLWSFDEAKGLWKEEGSANKTGNSYVGDVSHFSFWNCDVPNNYVHFSCTIVDSTGQPLAFTLVKLTSISNPAVNASGWTDVSGYVGGWIMPNSQFRMDVSPSYSCITYTQTVNSGTTAVSLGTIIIPGSQLIGQVSGSVTDCNGLPVSNGYIMVLRGGNYTRYNLNNGSYQFSASFCPPSTLIRIYGFDSLNQQLSTATDHYLHNGANNIPVIQACGIIPASLDGKYSMNGYHNRPPANTYGWPYANVEMDMVTIGTNQVAFFWPDVDDFGHPIGVGPTTLNWYGTNIQPVVTIDPATNMIVSVHNMNSQSAVLVRLYSGPLPTNNHYDPITRKLYVAFEYNNNPDRAWFDTLLYVGPR